MGFIEHILSGGDEIMNYAVIDWSEILQEGVEIVRQGKREQTRCVDWFFAQEILMNERIAMEEKSLNPDDPENRARVLMRLAERIPLNIFPGQALAGSQDAAFSPSYALINPKFKVENFAGYCDPTSIYNDLTPDGDITPERIARVKNYWETRPYVQKLHQISDAGGEAMEEVLFFAEPVTGHLVPDLRHCLSKGITALREQALELDTSYGRAQAHALEAVLILASRYSEFAREKSKKTGNTGEAKRLGTMADTLEQIPAEPCRTLQEAVQSFVLIWQIMVLEQSPNPYAFSVGNLDRILDPYFREGMDDRDEAVSLIRHLLTFFQVGNRCWAVSQNIIVGGSTVEGKDLSSHMTMIILDAFFKSNDPQPALSVKLHENTPQKLYESLGRFFFTPGHSTPSFFRDEGVFDVLRRQGVDESDLENYGVAGCQEPLIMGKSSINSTNTWLNLAKVLELACNDGISLISGKRLGPSWEDLGYEDVNAAYADLYEVFRLMLEQVLPIMAKTGNAFTYALGKHLPVPFTSVLMGGLDTGRDIRNPENPGVKYGGSGCLIHGLSVVANGLHAVEQALNTGRANAYDIRAALQTDYSKDEELRAFLCRQEHYGNGEKNVDKWAYTIVQDVGERIEKLRNPAGHPFFADWSTPSTHLLYGYWVGSTPDGRGSRTMLGYGVDPLPGTATLGLEPRLISVRRLPFGCMSGGYASHIGIDPSLVKGDNPEQKALWLRDSVILPLFSPVRDGTAPYYVYLNVDNAAHLRKVLENPKKYAPDGVYILRIHGTFVNFLDLSPAIQQDIMERLDPQSTKPVKAV